MKGNTPATRQMILNKRIRRAKARVAKGKAKEKDIILLASVDAKERYDREEEARRIAFEHAINK